MDEHIIDYKLLSYYQSLIQRSASDRKLLASQFHCHKSGVKIPTYGSVGIFVMANDKQSKLWGLKTCKNPWSCPVCSAKKMSEYAQNIACAIEALYKWERKVAFMITFSVPHTSRYTCAQTYEILKRTWNRFHLHGNKVHRNHKRDPFSNFCQEFNCTNRVRVCEFTWGENGWHPHFHCLFWVDKDKLQDVKKYQQRLHDQWLKIAHMMTKKVLLRDFVPSTLPPWDTRENVIRWIDNFFGQAMRKTQRENFAAAYISVDAKGNVARAQASQYICGWGADRELTGNIRKKASNENHRTPYQILCEAFNAHKKGDRDAERKWSNLYMEYARTVSHTFRIKFSPETINTVKKWKQTQEYIAAYKKKAIENLDTGGSWQIVVWFKYEQWSDIYYLNLINEGEIIENILTLARLPDGRQRIIDYLLNYGIDISKNAENYFAKDIVKMFNAA